MNGNIIKTDEKGRFIIDDSMSDELKQAILKYNGIADDTGYDDLDDDVELLSDEDDYDDNNDSDDSSVEENSVSQTELDNLDNLFN